MAETAPIKLNFPSKVRVAGETLTGTADVDLKRAQEDGIENVRVKLRGSIHTQITRSTGQSSVTYKSTIPLVRADETLWTQGSAYPPPGTHVLTLPFEFQLPQSLPPSFHCRRMSSRGIISYSIELVGDRPGLFKLNRRIRQLFPVVPVGTPQMVDIKGVLDRGFTGQWTTREVKNDVRQGIWGGHAHVSSKFSIPALSAYPIFAKIPFRIDVTTITKTMKRVSDDPIDKNGKPIFPAPPYNPTEIKFTLERFVRIKARSQREKVSETAMALGNMHVSVPGGNVRVTVDDAEWVLAPGKEDKGEGMWKRAVHFESLFTLTCPPSFSTDTLTCDYSLHIRVPFPGLLNDLKANYPISILSGTLVPPPAYAGAGPSNIAYAPPDAGPLPDMDLPPSYWTGEHHDWDGDEKSEKN